MLGGSRINPDSFANIANAKILCSRGLKCDKECCPYHHPHPERSYIDWQLCLFDGHCPGYKSGICSMRHLKEKPVNNSDIKKEQSEPKEFKKHDECKKPEEFKKQKEYKKKCKYGVKCNNPRCKFMHYPKMKILPNINWKLCPDNEKCEKLKSGECEYRHVINGYCVCV